MTSYVAATSSTDDPTSELRALREASYDIIRAALERTFYYWLKKFAPKRFTKEGFTRYKNLRNHYKRQYKGDREYKDKYLRILNIWIQLGKATDKPLMDTGKIKRAFLHGNYKFTGGKAIGNLKVTWTGLPGIATSKRKSKKTFNIPDALMEITSQEAKELAVVFDKFLQKELDRATHRKTHGRVSVYKYKRLLPNTGITI